MTEETQNQLKIWQQNQRKLVEAHDGTLLAISEEQDIICIQEPYLNSIGLTTLPRGWIAIYPTTHRDDKRKRTRSLIMVNTKIRSDSWMQLDVHSTDITAIQLKGGIVDINIYNIYNSCKNNNTLRTLKQHLEDRERKEMRQKEGEGAEKRQSVDIWLRDLNRHHPLWEDDNNDRLFTKKDLENAEVLIEMLAEHDMEMALPKDIPTIRNSRGNLTRPDNVFITGEAAD